MDRILLKIELTKRLNKYLVGIKMSNPPCGTPEETSNLFDVVSIKQTNILFYHNSILSFKLYNQL